MKKLVVLTAALALFAAPAFAVGISGTGHATAGCIGCHAPHSGAAIDGASSNTNGTKFLARGDVGGNTSTNINEMCFACHDGGGGLYVAPGNGTTDSLFGSHTPGSYDTAANTAGTDHPVGTGLTLAGESGPFAGKFAVYCTSCHDPHDKFTQDNLLITVGGTVNEMCGACHTNQW